MREIFNEPNSKSLGFGSDACIIYNNKFIITEWYKGDEQLLVWKASEVIEQNVRALAK